MLVSVSSIDELDEYAAVLCTLFHSTRSIGTSALCERSVGWEKWFAELTVPGNRFFFGAENLLGLHLDAHDTRTDSEAATGDLQLDSATLTKLEDLGKSFVVLASTVSSVMSLIVCHVQRFSWMKSFSSLSCVTCTVFWKFICKS